MKTNNRVTTVSSSPSAPLLSSLQSRPPSSPPAPATKPGSAEGIECGETQQLNNHHAIQHHSIPSPLVLTTYQSACPPNEVDDNPAGQEGLQHQFPITRTSVRQEQPPASEKPFGHSTAVTYVARQVENATVTYPHNLMLHRVTCCGASASTSTRCQLGPACNTSSFSFIDACQFGRCLR